MFIEIAALIILMIGDTGNIHGDFPIRCWHPDYTLLNCPAEPPKYCLKWTGNPQINCVETNPRLDADPDRMRYEFFKEKWNRRN